MLEQTKYALVIQVVAFLTLTGCKEKSYSQNNSEMKQVEGCYITKPVRNDSKSINFGDLQFGKEGLSAFLTRVVESRETLSFDSAVAYTTAFENQQLINVSNRCIKYLTDPGKIDFMPLYLSSLYQTRQMNRSIIEYKSSYKKNVLNYGDVQVFEFQLNGVEEVGQHFMHIILKEQNEDESRVGKDATGFVFFSDGLRWKDQGTVSIPLYIDMIKRTHGIVVPMLYENDRFIPIGHFREGEWKQ